MPCKKFKLSNDDDDDGDGDIQVGLTLRKSQYSAPFESICQVSRVISIPSTCTNPLNSSPSLALIGHTHALPNFSVYLS